MKKKKLMLWSDLAHITTWSTLGVLLAVESIHFLEIKRFLGLASSMISSLNHSVCRRKTRLIWRLAGSLVLIYGSETKEDKNLWSVAKLEVLGICESGHLISAHGQFLEEFSHQLLRFLWGYNKPTTLLSKLLSSAKLF